MKKAHPVWFVKGERGYLRWAKRNSGAGNSHLGEDATILFKGVRSERKNN